MVVTELRALSETAVTSAPLSIIKLSVCPPIWTSANHADTMQIPGRMRLNQGMKYQGY